MFSVKMFGRSRSEFQQVEGNRTFSLDSGEQEILTFVDGVAFVPSIEIAEKLVKHYPRLLKVEEVAEEKPAADPEPEPEKEEPDTVECAPEPEPKPEPEQKPEPKDEEKNEEEPKKLKPRVLVGKRGKRRR